MRDLRSTIPTNPNEPYPVRNVDKITHIIIHHSATEKGSARAYANWHIKQYDWPGIAYHYVLDPDGTVNKTLDHHKVGHHCKGMNTKSIGIVLTGNFMLTEPTEAQISSLVNLLADLRKNTDWVVGYHDQYNKPECPGKFFPKDIVARRLNVIENPPDPADEHEPDIPMPDDPPEEPEEPEPEPEHPGKYRGGCRPPFFFINIP